jgi:TonB family protein
MAESADMDRTSARPEGGEINFLREYRDPVTPRRVAIAVVTSILYHVVVIGSIVLAPDIERIETAPVAAAELRKAVPLYLPPELMQKDPNKGKVTRMLDVRSAAAPSLVPQAPKFRPPEPVVARNIPAAPPVVSPVVQQPPKPEPARIEPPKIEAESAPPPVPAGRLPQTAPPPPDKPKLAFENVGSGGSGPRTTYTPNPFSKVPDPKTAAENALRASVQPSPNAAGQGASGVVVGDVDEMNAAASPDQAGAAGPVRSNLQLLSDPKGFDFKPYLIQVLTAVRANWLAVIPESARLGRRGRVLVQFIIDKRGGIPKLVIAESSGAAALDRAAVAGISASNPLPPLPAGFTGNEIRLQLAFAYNQPAAH